MSFASNDAGARTSMVDSTGTTTYSYDDADRLTAVSYPGGSVTYGYDAAGRRTSMIDAAGSSAWTYDAAGRTLSTASPQGTVQYSYNAAGDRTAMELPGSRVVTYAYDPAGRLSSLTDWLSRQTTFGYDADGKRTAVTLPTDVVSATTFDAAGRTTAINHTLGSTTLASFVYTLDAAGNRTGVTTGSGTESYSLDSLSRISAVTYADGSTVSYTYDHNGNRLTKTQGGSTTNYAYDAAGELTSDGTSTYSYDANGNLVSRGSDTFGYDWASRMTAASVGGVSTSYSYDGDGVRTAKTIGGGTQVTYLWDRESGLPLLVDDGSSAYLQVGGPIEDVDTAGTPQYHLNDALRSTRALTDQAGSLTASLDYDAFGAPRAASGATSALTFAGEQTDTETGFTYLRARYLDPAVGRFTNADSVQPSAPGTQGFNLYAYAVNNPMRWTDPSGHTPSAALLAVESACFRTAWCADALANGLERAAVGGLVGLSGGEITVFILLACVLDVTIERATDGAWHYGGCSTLFWAAYKLINQNGSPVPAPVMVGGNGVPPNQPPSGGGGGGTTTVEQPPLPAVLDGVDFGGFPARKGPDGDPPESRRICVTELFDWLTSQGFEFKRQGPGGLEYETPDGKWRVEFKPEPAGPTTGPASQQPRVEIKHVGNEPSYYNPFDGQYYGPRSAEAHIGLDLTC